MESVDNSPKESIELLNANVITPDDIKNIVEIWKKVVDVQQHFNDLALRIRNYVLTAFTFIIGGIGYLQKEHILVNIVGFKVPASSLLALIGIVIVFAFLYMDRFWYHKFLLGAVKHGIAIETRWAQYLPELGLSIAIKNESPNKWGPINISSKNKFWVFYIPLFVVLLILFFSLLFSGEPLSKTVSFVIPTS